MCGDKNICSGKKVVSFFPFSFIPVTKKNEAGAMTFAKNKRFLLAKACSVASVLFGHKPMGSHHHQAAILVLDDKLDYFGQLANFFAWSKMI